MTELPHLARLEDRPLSEAWLHEEHVFSPWLAANLDGLSEVIGIPLEFEDREVRVHEFRADLLLRNPEDDTRILVENQLARADHRHLGQILTYLAGLDVSVVVWIAEDFREAHLSAINWLNEHTSAEFSFFAIKLRVVRIGDSPLAPILDVVAKPNEWERQLQAQAPKANEMSSLGQFRRDFWDAYLTAHPEDAELGVAPTAASSVWISVEPDAALNVALWVGRTKTGLFIRGPRGTSDGGDLVDRFEPVIEPLTERLGTSYGRGTGGHFWGKQRRIDMTDRANWPDAIEWLHMEATRYVTALKELMTEEEGG